MTGEWFGLDTERDAKSGEFVCGWIHGENGKKKFEGFRDLGKGYYWIWNLPYDIEGMIRDEADEDGWLCRKDGAEFPFCGGKARYFHGKRFDLRMEGGRRTFLEANSYWGKLPLWKLGEKLNYPKLGLEGKLMSKRLYSLPGYRRVTDEYCQRDAEIVYRGVMGLKKSLEEIGGIMAATPGGTARQFIGGLGQFPEVLWRTRLAFARSYKGGRFEVVKWGFIHGPVRQYDITSAYPDSLARTPWLTDTAVNKFTRRYSEDALMGSYKVSFKTDEYLGLAPVMRQTSLCFSRAQNETWITRPELEWLLRKGFDVHIHEGVEIFDENASMKWGEAIKELYEVKKKGGPARDGAKTILVSLYGVMAQLNPIGGKWVPLGTSEVEPIDFSGDWEFVPDADYGSFEAGRYHAPAYAGHLTALTRLKILDAALESGYEKFIGTQTDSIFTLGTLKCGKELGDFALEEEAPCLTITKTGMSAMNHKVKMRGITRDGTAAMLIAERHERQTRVSVKLAKTWEDVSVIKPKSVANNLGQERKRFWLGQLTRDVIRQERFVDSEALAYV